MEKSPYELLVDALSKNEFDKYLIGKGEYHFTDRLVEYPTNYRIVFSSGINEYCKRHGKDSLNHDLHQALIALLDTPVGCWWCTTLIYGYLRAFPPDTLLFRIDLEQLMDKIDKELPKHKEALSNNKEFVGYRFKNGLWTDTENKLKEISITRFKKG